MLDTKSKNSRKAGAVTVLLLLMLCSAIMMARYGDMAKLIESMESPESRYEEVLYGISRDLMEGNYLLYNEYAEETTLSEVLNQYGQRPFDLVRKYLEYGVFDPEGNSLFDNVTDEESEKLSSQNSEYFAFRTIVSFSDNGMVSDIQVDGKELDPQVEYALETGYVNDLEEIRYDAGISTIATPANVDIIFAMTSDQLQEYAATVMPAYMDIYVLGDSEPYMETFLALGMLVSLAALLLPLSKKLDISECRCFRIPFEADAAILILGAGFLYYLPVYIVYMTIRGDLVPGMGHGMDLLAGLINFIMWVVLFGILFAVITSLRAIIRMKGAYWKERTLTARIIRYMKKEDGENGEKIRKSIFGIFRKIKTFLHNQYEFLQHIDFRSKTNRTILKVVVLNYIILMLICLLWWYGALALLIYSLILFFFLKKYVRDIQSKYSILLSETNQLAEGHLDVPIQGDVGIFNPIQDELKRIQRGFKKAVDEEVKNERMKTELVTNVSHDLRTPLTAIITYTDLLKNEQDEERRKEYTEILEKKALRLKVLIEDLFEISKAASKSVTMNYMKVDIVDLLKQVGLENEDKIRNADLEFRWRLSESKIIMWLDSQKTYRIFENLITNITKYAMPHTRAYVDMEQSQEYVHISMKNVSAAELTFNTEEITDRFVRGDTSRNTEGSGLGLAIAKSFAELQHGSLRISTEADLFKVDIVLPKQKIPQEAGTSVDL